MKAPPELLSFLKEKDDFFIATHINPEGDALGSSIALSMALEIMGKSTILYVRDSIPGLYKFLPGHERFRNSVLGLQPPDLTLLLLDCNTPERAGIEGISFRHCAVIDHHETETDFGDVRWVKPQAAATGMMIFHLIKDLGLQITKEMAVNLYAAVAIDTGTFRFGNTTAEVLRVAAELAEAGAKPGCVSTSLYETWAEQRFRLLIMALNTFEIRDNVAFTFVTREMFDRTGTGPEDTENFSSLPKMIRDISIVAFFRETGDNEWKVSLRSKGSINVAEIATLFQGGGHRKAAGYTIKATLEDAKEILLKSISRLSHSLKEA
jgi:phosphoesterase RecJ-like protein